MISVPEILAKKMATLLLQKDCNLSRFLHILGQKYF
jgi:hypothetical protein